MKFNIRRFFLPIFCSVVFALVFSPVAHAQVQLSFSGGNGTPLSITVNEPVVYDLAASTEGGGSYLDIHDVGNIFAGQYTTGSGSLTFSVVGSFDYTYTVTFANTSQIQGDMVATDLVLGSTFFPALSVGDVLTLESGTFTTDSDYAYATPTGGVFSTFVVDQVSGDNLGNGISSIPVPEPSNYVMGLAAFSALLVGHIFRRRSLLS